MATKKIKGVVIPRHDTAINWAKATNFVPRDGELIVFTADNIPLEEISTNDAPIWTSYDDESNLIACDYNNRTDFTYVGSTQDLTVATMVDGCMVDGTSVPYMNLDENGTYVDSGSSFNLTPSAKTRFKFGDGKTNVNLLPFIETGSSNGEGPTDLNGYATEEYVRKYVNQYDSIALMEVTKSDTGILELNDVYAIQNNANITVENKDVTYSFYSKNFVDTKCCLKDWVENYDTNYGTSTSEEFRSCTLSEYPIGMMVVFSEDNGDLANYAYLTDLTGTGIFVSSFTALANNASINFDYGNYIPDYNHIDVHNLQVNATYKLIIQVEETYDESSERYYNRIPRVYLLQLANNEDDAVLYVGDIEPDASGNIDSSLMMSPTTIIVPNSSDAFNNLITATYDTEYKVDQHYNKDSAIPQSGTAVAEALDSLVTVMKGSSIDDITAAGVTSKVVILYED